MYFIYFSSPLEKNIKYHEIYPRKIDIKKKYILKSTFYLDLTRSRSIQFNLLEITENWR